MDKTKDTNPDADETSEEDTSTQTEEIGGSDKPEPTRYGDWEVDGRCTDF